MAILKIFVLVIFCVFSVVNGNIADQTCFTSKPVRSLGPKDDGAFVGSYIEYVEDPQTLNVTLGRILDTGGGAIIQKADSEPYERHFKNKRYVYRELLSVETGTHRVGAFFCNVTGLRNQTSPSYIPVIILAKDAYIKPERQTQTVSFGETATIQMTLTEGDAVNLRWRLNGNVIDIWSGSSDITIPYVTKDDIGIYECYLNDRRDESKHAIVRLIVRGCSASHYGTDCQNFCPTCYNGGVCDDVSGLCVCPPGFKGEDCSEGCGNNHWGRTCVNLCSSRNPGCPDQMGCVPDPLGCSCMAGYKDLDCKGTCGTGYYGSTCSEQCHCAPGVTCDPSRGCPDGPCEAGYSGTNCQVPDSCTNGRYGELCKYQCHCDDDGPCDRNTGSCSDRKCKHLWIGSDCQLDGRTKVTLEDPSSNRGVTSVTITCIVQANPIPSDEDIQVLHGDDILENGVSTATELSYTKTIVFSNITIAEDDVFKCQVQSNISGDARTEKVVTIYDRPVMTVKPSVIASNSTVTVSWNEWTKSENNGDGPVIGYYVCYKQTGETWESCSNTVTGLSIVFNIDGDNNDGFQQGVEYEFGVAAIRPGSLGSGIISPLTQFIIPCLPPVIVPSNVQVSVVSDSEIEVQWQPISISPDRCNSLSKYTLRYTNDNISHQTKTVLAAETMEVVSSIISDLDPCTAYDVRVAATNSAGDGPFSDVVLIKTDSEVPNAVKNPNLESGNRSITVMWEAPDYEHCQIEHYKLTYQLENQGLCGENEEAFEETKTVTELSHTIDNLEPYSRYIIEISAVTHHQSKEGPITTINATTNEGEPLDGPEDIEGMITINATNEFPGSITINFGSVSCLKRRGEITNYIVQVVDEDGNIIGPEKTSAQHATITGIHPCETVTPHVAACTLVGCGEFATGPDITMNTAAPGNVSVKVQHHQKVKKMNVTWSVPEVVYCPIVLYQIMYRRILLDGCQKESHAYTIKSVNGSTTKYILKDLPPFSTYEVVVSAGVNKSDNDGIIYGFGRAGFNTTKQQAPIAAPENVAYDTINARSFNFTWEEIPCGSRQGSIDRYIYVLKHGNSEPKKGTVEGDLYVVLDNLSPCTTYDFKVRGEGTAGKGPQANIQATTISEVPTKVGNGLIIEDGLTFEWDRPRPLACEIVKYYIEANLTNKDMCHASTTDDALSFEEQDTNIDLSDLEPYSEYVVTISAETDVGIGPAYIQNISTPEQAPLAGPRDLFNTSLSSENATFKWTEIECGSRRGFIRGYKFSIHTTVGEEDILTDDDVTDREYHVTNLKPFTEYIVRVRGFNSIGDSDSKELGFITKESTPTVPRNINILNTDTVSFLIEWSRPEPANGIVISYQLIVVGNEEVLIVYNVSDAERDTLAFSYEVRELTPNTNYTIQAAAFTSVGRGPLSDIIYVLTIPGKPGPVSNFQINNTEEKSVTVSWGKPKNPNGEILKYTLKYRILEKLFEPDADITGEWIDATECKGALNKNCTIEDLEPATKYAIEVYASTEAGDGKHLTKNTTTDTPPVPKQPTLKVVSTTDSTITVELFPLEDFIYISNYVILVEKESSAKRRNAKEKLTHKDSPDKYISASFPRDEVPDLFIIGDGKVHNGYYNAPLSKDNKYFLSFRTDDAIDDESRSGKAIQPGSNDTSIGMILGILFGFIVAVLVLGLVWFLKYKRREKNPPKPMLPMSKLKTESRLPHVPSEDTIADTINSYTKPPLKAKPESSKATRVHRPVKIEHLVAYVKKKRMDKEEGFQNDFESLPNEQIHSWDVAKKSENKTKNRYGNIVAYDHCRVVLEPLPGDPHSDYINACYIDGYKQKVAYIATQGPNIASVDDIWRMAWKERSSIIIMVTNLFEAGKKKCEKYWPEKSQTYGRIDVKITDEEECPQYTIRSFKMTKDDEIREIKQFHFTVWPDMGVPEFANDVLRFIDVVKKNGNFDTGPTIVHCSAGVGRTGTMIAINEMLDMARDEGKINVFNFVNQMRKNRVKMVQTLDQYFFIFDALLEAVVCGQTSTKAADINPFYNSLLTSNTLTKRSYILEQYNALEAMNAVMTEENTAGGRLPANVAKNRFLSRIPIDGSRPYLMTLSSEDSTNYINASFLHGYRGKDMYISTQMPLPNTIADFLCMVYDYKSKLIVMLNDDPSTDQTYGKYWPESGSEQHGPMIIEHVSTENSKAAICRTFQLKNTSRSKEKPREIKQYQYLGWPSSSKIPSSAESVLEFLKLLDREDIPSDAPITVHCKNGMERCGVFCTIHSVLQQLQHEQIVDVFHTIRKFRRSKPNMVSPVSQYEFCFNTVRCYLDAFEIYSNYK